jgi:hypothetical protein
MYEVAGKHDVKSLEDEPHKFGYYLNNDVRLQLCKELVSLCELDMSRAGHVALIHRRKPFIQLRCDVIVEVVSKLSRMLHCTHYSQPCCQSLTRWLF